MAQPDHSRAGISTGGSGRLLLAWGLLRIPLILVLVLAFRETISALPIFDGATIIVRIIDLLSLPVSRAILFLILVGLIGLLVPVAARMKPVVGYWLLLGAVIVVSLVLFGMTGTPLRYVLMPILLAATNFLPDSVLERRTDNRFMSVAIGFTELFIIRRHVAWLAGLADFQPRHEKTVRLVGWVLAVVLLSGFLAVLVKGGRLIPVEQSIRMTPSATIVMREDVNGLTIDPVRRRLYATGHGLENIVEIDLDHAGAAPRVSEVDSSGAQGMARNVAHSELIVFNGDTQQVQLIDEETLTLKRAIDVSQLASGDPWIAVDPVTDTIAIISEADLDDGVAFILLDRTTGEVLDTRDMDAGNILKHPGKPWLYLSFFRRSPEMMIYDMEAREIIGQVPTPLRLDRMLMLPETNELLVTSPVTSEILRFDEETLVQTGSLKGIFGVRTLAHDPERNLLFAGSFVTGQIITIDTRTGRALGTVYLGPWLRSIELDVATGTAYVSSNGILYRWSYDTDL